MRAIKFIEAICEAMSEEMRRDESVFFLWDEIAEYNGVQSICRLATGQARSASLIGLSYEYVF